jgi:fumarylpyruvate hydrolase
MFPPVELPTLPVLGRSWRFPVRRILCIGKNYPAHAREMGDSGKAPPVHFLKSPPSLLAAPGPVELPYPPATRDLQHEIELVVALHSGGRRLDPTTALQHVHGYAVGLDMTRRDLQQQAKAAGQPWAAGKDFDASAVCGPIVPAEQLGHPNRGAISLRVNGVVRQQGDLADMIWSVPQVLAYLSGLMTLGAGDLIYTGTPAGVGPVEPGHRLRGTIEGLPPLDVTVVDGPFAEEPAP